MPAHNGTYACLTRLHNAGYGRGLVGFRHLVCGGSICSRQYFLSYDLLSCGNLTGGLLNR